jgi:hypothetical protein
MAAWSAEGTAAPVRGRNNLPASCLPHPHSQPDGTCQKKKHNSAQHKV